MKLSTIRKNDAAFSTAADVSYGSICCLCFLIGTVGNIASLIYFKSKKREISSVIYMFISLNDMVISIAAFLAGVTFWSQRRPVLVFETELGCAAWLYTWKVSVSFSIFLVMSLSVSRTLSLLFPFKKQRVRYLVTTTVIFLLLTFGRIKILHMLVETEIEFRPWVSRCDVYLVRKVDLSVFLILQISNNLAFTAPTFVVSISCVISVVLLRKKNKTVRQRELQRSRTRATVTILLFALLYGVCNIPLAVDFILRTYSWATNNTNLYKDLYQFDNSHYFRNAVDVLLIVANSAANPLLYFWRMPTLREYTLTGMRRILRLNKTG